MWEARHDGRAVSFERMDRSGKELYRKMAQAARNAAFNYRPESPERASDETLVVWEINGKRKWEAIFPTYHRAWRVANLLNGIPGPGFLWIQPGGKLLLYGK